MRRRQITKTKTAKRLLKRELVTEERSNGFRRQYYTVDGKLDGEYKRWDSDGDLLEHYYYKNGKREGEYKAWYSNGQLMAHRYYKNDKLDGEYKSWYDNGQLIAHCHYKNGVKVK